MATILMTNIVFAARSGTEVATLELAQALRARGHRVVIFSPTLGATAQEARALGIPVTSRVEDVALRPDIIHGNHNCALAMAMVRFPDCPAVFVCHDTASRFDEPILDRRIGLFVAVDAACRDRMVVDGVDPASIVVIPNAVDLDRFVPRDDWRPDPRTALLVVKNRTDHVPLVERACRRAGLLLDVVGPGVGRIVPDLAGLCRRADIVLAHSRSAIEAVAVGAAVIVLDELGYGGWFRRREVDGWPDTPLSNRVLSRLPTEDELAQALIGYDAAEARGAMTRLRGRVDLRQIAAEWEHAYVQAMENVAGARNAEGPDARNGVGLARFLSCFMPRLDQSTAHGDTDRRAKRHEDVLQLYLDLLRPGDAGLRSVAFVSGSVGEVLLAEGWHGLEPCGVWSAADRAGLWLPEPLLARWNHAMQVDCTRYLPHRLAGDETREVRVFLGPHLLATWRFSRDHPGGIGPTVLQVPSPLRPEPGRSVLLTFCVDSPFSPAEAGESTDQRRLGLRLAAVRAAPVPG